MKNIQIVSLLISIIIFTNIGCSKSVNTKPSEQEIIENLFPEIFEYTFDDSRKRPIPPPPPSNDSKEELDKMHKAFENAKIEHQIFIDTTIFATLFVIVSDSAWGIPKSELKRIYNEENENLKFIDTTNFKNSFKIDLSKIDLGKDYVLKYKSHFSTTIDELINEEWLKHSKKEIHLHQYTGILSLSRIYFNSEQNYGFLIVSFGCGKLCGCDYRFFIKKIADKWVIDKIDDLGCA